MLKVIKSAVCMTQSLITD